MPETTTPAAPRFTFATAITLVALIAQALMLVEMFAPSSSPGKLLQVVGMVLTAFGAPLLARSGAKVLPVALLVLLAVGLLPACTEQQAKDTTVRIGKSAIDCLAPSVKPLAAELLPTFRDVLENAITGDGKLDEAPIRATAESLKSDATRCAFSIAMSELLRGAAKLAGAPMSAPLEVDKDAARATFEAVRAGWGGATFKLESGEL